MLIRRKIGELRVSELRAELEKRNLDSKGLKGALLQRLQKAITEEGGDVNQIEVEAAASPSAKIKNSPRIKRSLEPLDADIKKAPSIAAKAKPDESVTSDSDNTQMAVGVPIQAKDDAKIAAEADAEKSMIGDESANIPEKLDDVTIHEDTSNEGSSLKNIHLGAQEKDEERSGQEGLASSKDDYSEAYQDDNQDSVEDYDNEPIVNEENKILVDEEDTSKQYDDDEEDEFVELVDNCDEGDNEQAENFEDETLVENFSSNVEMNSGDEEMPDMKQTDDNEANMQLADTTSTDYVEDADVGAEEPDENSSNIAMEDDVLDMLDYDIEIPEQTSQEEGSKDGVSVDDGTEEGDVKAKVSGSSSETDIKDPSDKTESVSEIKIKEGADADDVKLSKNLWISGLSASTRASELKVAFSRYGKVVGAKVVTSARSPGSKCYGFVAMATLSAADKCILHLNRTELHGRVITVEHTKNDPSARKAPRGGRDDKNSSTDSKDPSSHPAAPRSRRSTSDAKGSKSQAGDSSRGSLESGKRPRRSASMERSRARTQSSRGGGRNRGEPFRKRPRALDNRERKVVIDNKRGAMSLRVNVRSAQGGRRPHVLRRIAPPPSTSRKFESRHAPRGRGRAPPDRPRDARDAIRGKKAPESGSRSALPMALTASIERDRLLLQKEREERNYLRDQREKLERERRQLERDRLERERLEHERIRLEQERKRELEKIEREKREMKRLQEINRYELSQRQRALKRMHDDRVEKRVDRDDRRRFDPDSRDRGGSSMDVYRDDRGGMRPRGTASSRMEGGRSDKSSYHDIDRRNMTHDTDARYGHSSNSAGGRRVEKYDRSGMKPAGDFGHERRGNGDNPRGSLSYRHQDKDASDDRKVVPRDRGRPGNSGMKDIGPPGRGGSPGMSWKDSKSSSAGGSRSRAPDRDLREEIRQGGGSGRKPSERGDHRHRDPSANRRSPSLARSDSVPFERNQSDSGSHHNAPMASGGNPIPTTGRNGMNSFQPSTTWPAWQERPGPESGGMWHGPRGPSGPMPGGAPVGRMMAPMGAPFNSMNPINPPIRMTGGMLGHGISPNYVPPDQRVDNFKHIRRY